MIYLASPYSHPDAAVREARFQAVCRFAAAHMRNGVRLYSPIAHSHPLAAHGGLPTDWTYWRDYDIEMLAACNGVWVLMLDGWQVSAGVTAEMELARQLRLPIEYKQELA